MEQTMTVGALLAEMRTQHAIYSDAIRQVFPDLWQDGTMSAIRDAILAHCAIKHSLRSDQVDSMSAGELGRLLISGISDMGKVQKWSDLHKLHDKLKAAAPSLTDSKIIADFRKQFSAQWGAHRREFDSVADAEQSLIKVLRNYRGRQKPGAKSGAKSSSRRKISSGTSRARGSAKPI
jgi:hypothetical protein